ncbi:hypothetical protein VTN00DRAFT_1990 [Thermoascus crustaceus]|uniref:uncharacterized protein n=1 Tax=Thermoascus crustaceus TaxID=5088 RepID=UPI003744668B
MTTPTVRRVETQSPAPPSSPERPAGSTNMNTTTPPADQTERPGSSGSDASSASSNVTTLSRPKGSLYNLNSQPGPSSPHPPRTSSVAANSTNNSNISLPTSSRPSAAYMPQNDPPARKSPKSSPRVPPLDLQKHRPRQHSQGFFEPSLPTASSSEHSTAMANLTASQIAAQAAMQHQSSSQQHLRQRSQTIPNMQDEGTKKKRNSRDSPPPPLLTSHGTSGTAGLSGQTYQNGLVGGHVLAATTAANAAFPRSPVEQVPEREHKPKGEKSKMKLFKPKHIGITRDKDPFSKDKMALPSPNKMGLPGPSGLSRMVNASTASLADTMPSTNSSMYNLSNASATTVVPAEKQTSNEKEKEKEKEKDKTHKHHFLSRQKLKLKDKDDHYNLPLSSASSNSKPLDPSAPQSLYSFTPSSPGPSSTSFGKSVTGLDLLHGGRAKKKDEKALDLMREPDPSDWLASSVGGNGPQVGSHGPSSLGSSTSVLQGEAALREALQGFGLHNMSPEDAWDFLKAKILVVFDGEDVRIAIEDLNKLVLVHVQRCVQRHQPSVIVEDLRELLQTGFASLNHSITTVPDEKVVPYLVQIWMLVFGTILPFMQAVFLPLDLEFKGRGSVMSAREAKEFWGALPKAESSDVSMGDELDVRSIVLIAFRDTVILPRYEGLKATFSRLSLDNINLGVSALSITPNSNSSGGRPGTAASLDPGFSSYNSQSSTLLNAAVSYSSDSASLSRSRAASNTSSNPDQLIFQSLSSPSSRPTIRSTDAADSSHVITETVGRMLQCVSVLASVQSGDEAQEQIETLSKALKHNWLGRGRIGRDRRGFVGAKVRPVVAPRQDSSDSIRDRENGYDQLDGQDGSPNLSML